MRIGDLATATGASARSLRYYEDQGLLASERSSGGQRHYPESAVERVSLIQCLLGAGLSSSTIYEVLPCISEQAIRTPWLAQRLRTELTRVDEQITALGRTRDILAGLVQQYSTVPAPSQLRPDSPTARAEECEHRRTTRLWREGPEPPILTGPGRAEVQSS